MHKKLGKVVMQLTRFISIWKTIESNKEKFQNLPELLHIETERNLEIILYGPGLGGTELRHIPNTHIPNFSEHKVHWIRRSIKN